jgi:hypothetical protein
LLDAAGEVCAVGNGAAAQAGLMQVGRKQSLPLCLRQTLRVEDTVIGQNVHAKKPLLTTACMQ